MKSRLGTEAEGPVSSPEGRVTESDAQALRVLAEEISREAAPRLEQTALVLYDRDPGYLQAQWYVTPQALAEARRLFPGDGAGLRQVLRLCRLDRDGRPQVVASTPQGSGATEGAGEDGFALPGDGAEYSCELGLESDAGGWLLLARSNRVRSVDRQGSLSRTTAGPDDPQAWNASLATPEEPSEFGDIPVEAALAAVGEPLHPVFPNLELDDAPMPGERPASLEKALGQIQPGDRRPESPPDILQDAALDPETNDSPPRHPAPLAEAPRQAIPKQEIPDQAGPRDREPEFPSDIPHGLAPDPETGAELPSDAPVEAALAAVGEPLYPVFPNLELDDALPEHPASLEEAPGWAWLQDWRLEPPSGILQDSVPYLETTTDLPPGADLVDMPPPLLPSSPGLSTATADMPGPIYDPRAALSSAVLSTGLPPMPDLELHAELIVQGRAAGSSRVDLFGHPIAVGADGRFYIRRPLDISALESLAAGGGLLAWLEATGHG